MQSRIPLALLLVCGYLLCAMQNATGAGMPPEGWATKAEATNYQETPRYDETVAYCRRLAARSPYVHVESIGRSPEGREIIAVIVSSDKAFTPEAARATGKEIVLVNCCIHPGESEGKDAGMALVRDMTVVDGHEAAVYLDHAILVYIPIFGVDGHERFGAYNRINQNGPAEMGWRTSAQNYNLNRDWVKADAPEMRAMLAFYHRWRPDLFVDTHTTDGADYQYDLTYSVERFANQHPAVAAWQKDAFEGHIFPALEKQGRLIAPYIVFKNEREPREGFEEGATLPRFSTGYGALWNRSVLLVETHMLKDYRNRVTATYDLLAAILTEIDRNPGVLRRATEQADRETIAAGTKYDPARTVPVDFKNGPGSVPFEFKGVEYAQELSAISGAPFVRFDASKPITFTVPLFNEVQVTKAVNPPLGYIVPVAWSVVIERLKAHGIVFTTLTRPLTQEVETYLFDKVVWQDRPFENHHAIKDWTVRPIHRQMTFPAGSALVYLDQPAAKVVLNLLEPEAPDSLVRWGYLDAIFEQKEYAEDYVMEPRAREMLARDPKLKAEFEKRLAADAIFAANPHARLSFFYERTPYWDDRLNVYPIGRIFERVEQP